MTISLSNPPPKLPGHVYDLGQVAQQAADLLSSVIGTTCKQRSSSQSLSCVKVKLSTSCKRDSTDKIVLEAFGIKVP